MHRPLPTGVRSPPVQQAVQEAVRCACAWVLVVTCLLSEQQGLMALPQQ
jgi:hypothetical protein